MNKLLSIVIFVLEFAGFILLMSYPQSAIIVFLIMLAILIVAVFILQKEKKISTRFLKLISPVLLLSGGIAFFLFIENKILRYLMILLISWCLYYYLRYRCQSKKSGYFIQINDYMDLVTIFFISCGLYGFIIFIGFSLIWLNIIFVIIIALLSLQAFQNSKVPGKKLIVYVIMVSVILGELLYTASFLPVSLYILGLIMTVSYGFLIEVSRNYYLQIPDWKKTNKKYFYGGLIILLLILLTARWK